MTQTPVLSILFICTGNICRSPLAAQLLDAEIVRHAGANHGRSLVHTSSRGTNTTPGAPMDARSAKQSRALGGDPTGHVAAPLAPTDLDEADLIITMTLEQRAEVARMRPAASKKTMTLLEFDRLLKYNEARNPINRGPRDSTQRARLEHLFSRRSMVPPVRKDESLSIADPFRRSSGTHARVARQIRSAVIPLATWLAAGSNPVTEEFSEPLVVDVTPVDVTPDDVTPDDVTSVTPAAAVAPATAVASAAAVAPVAGTDPPSASAPGVPLTRRQARELERVSEPVSEPEPEIPSH